MSRTSPNKNPKDFFLPLHYEHFTQPIGIAQYPDLLRIKEAENNEPFVNLQSSPVPWEFDERFQVMASVLPGQIIIRKSVRSLLEQAQENLRKTRPDSRLLVTYGFRTLEIQTRMFLRFLIEECAEFVPDPVKLYDKVHKKVAVPTVAGHPTGGAVDVTLVDALGQRLTWDVRFTISTERMKPSILRCGA